MMCLGNSGVLEPDFEVQSGRILGIFGLDWILFPIQPDPDYPNEVIFGHFIR